MKESTADHNQIIKGFLVWREGEDMVATSHFYKLIFDQVGDREFVKWTKVKNGTPDMSNRLKGKSEKTLKTLHLLIGLDTKEKRVTFLENNFAAFMEFTKDRYCPYGISLEELESLVKHGNNQPNYNDILDGVMVIVIANMTAAYRHFIFHLFNEDGSSSLMDNKGNIIALKA